MNYELWMTCQSFWRIKHCQTDLNYELGICVIQALMKSIIPYFIQFSFGRSLCNQHVTRVFRTFSTHPWFLHSPAPWLLAWPRRCRWLDSSTGCLNVLLKLSRKIFKLFCFIVLCWLNILIDQFLGGLDVCSRNTWLFD